MLLIAPLAGVAPAQQPAGNPPGFVVRSQTNVVLVDVRVTDRGGKPVTDLKQDDFRVYEDGVPQAITSFSLEDIERVTVNKAGGEGAAPATIDLSKLPPNTPVAEVIQDHRLMVLFFDMTSMPVDDLMRAERAASDFVHKRMTPADLVAIVTYTSGLSVIQNFTNDRVALMKALDSIRLGESSSLAVAGTAGEAGGTSASGAEIVNQDVSAAFTPDETEFNIFNTDQKLASVESLAIMLRGLPGRKSVIHFSSGIEKTGVENQAQLRATEDAANRANVSLYTIDARGLAALPPGGDASAASPAGTALYTGSAVSSQISSLQESRETLASLATDTGGRTFYDLNDFGEAFAEVQRENSSYYLIGYTPSSTKSDGRFRRIRVEVSPKGVHVEARPGYFAPKDFRHFTREDKDLQLEQALSMDLPFVDLPMAVEAAYFRQPQNQYYVVLAAKIPGAALSFAQKGQTHQCELDFVWRAASTTPATPTAATGTGRLSRSGDAPVEQAAPPGGFLRDTLPLKLDPEAYARLLRSNVLYEGGLVLPPGKYELKVVVRDNQSGKLGTFEQPLTLPAFDPAARTVAGGAPSTTAADLALSSVVLSNQLQQDDAARASYRVNRHENQTASTPLTVGSRTLLPSVTRVFRTDQNLYIYLQSYVAPDGSKKKSSAETPTPASSVPPSVALVFFRGGIKISEAGPYPGKMSKGPAGDAQYFVEIPLARFPPGRYWMQVNVIVPAVDRVAFARVPLAIMPPASSPSQHAGG